MMLTVEEVTKRFSEKFPECEIVEEFATDDTVWVLVAKEQLVDAAMFAKHELGLDLPITNSGYDDGINITVWNHVCNTEYPLALCLGTRLVKPDMSLPTLVHIWEGMDWHERETWDLVGVIFEGHPNLQRILNPPDWDGHPLQKDKPTRRRRAEK